MCGRVTYTYDTNPVNGAFSQYSTGRLTTAQYQVCAPGQVSAQGSTSNAGGAMTEMYSYHPAGAVTAKQMQVAREGTDSDGNGAYATGSVEADYTYNQAGQVATYGVQYPATPGPVPVTYTYAYDSMARRVL